MPSLKRYLLEGQVYHVTTATLNRVPLFTDARLAGIILESIGFVRDEKAHVLAFALMPDHLHLLMSPRPPNHLSDALHSLKGYSAWRINKALDHKGAIWRRSFFDRVIRDEAQLANAVEYIHAKPVVAGLARTPEEYAYSSAHPSNSVDLSFFEA